MLAALSIRDIVLIDKLTLSLEPGLCALTGETGAGKSILLDALSLAIGARADGGLVRLGAGQGSVTAVFDVPDDHAARALLRENELDDEGDLVLRRVQTKDGRTRAFVNDQPVSIGLLRALGDRLVEIHGQHDERGLLDPSGHRVLLDAFGGLGGLAAGVRAAWGALADARAALEAARAAQAKAKADQDYLIHMVEELSELDPQSDEERALADERSLMMHAENIVDDLEGARGALSGDKGLEGRLNLALRKLSKADAQAGGRLEAVIAALDRTLVEVAEARSALDEALRDMVFDPNRLEDVEARLFALRAAARKHNVGVDNLSALRQQFVDQLALIEGGEAELKELACAQDEAEAVFRERAVALSKARTAAAVTLDKAVAKELGPLKLDKATFHTHVTSNEEGPGGPDGFDQVAFLISTNPGAPLGPLVKIASGGELSRFVLALKVALASVGSAPTLIFDEVDAGVGGAVAEAVGMRLADLARDAQVLVVTHSPQVAARAQHHLRISKGGKARQVATQVDALDDGARREEIARMLAGAQVTEEARAAADRLIRSDL